MIRRALLYARTVRHLEPSQLVYQALRRLQGTGRPPETVRPAPVDYARLASLRERLVAWGPPWRPAPEVRARAQRLRDGVFDFVGVERALTSPDWASQHVSRLWTYNLQYFDYARELAWASQDAREPGFVDRFTALATSWVTATNRGGSPAWDPYPISLRVTNWIYAVALAGDSIDPQVREMLLASVYRQIAHLQSRVERHILGNHVIKNFAALAIGGLCFTDDMASRWREMGIAGLRAEIERQVNPDGGHVERSPMYHAIVMADLLEIIDVLRIADIELPQLQRQRVAAMADAYGKLISPDRGPRLFNDSAQGVAPHFEYLDRLNHLVFGAGIRSPRGAWSLPDTRFFGWAGEGESIAIDAGAPAPPYQAAHTHCGMLGFELEIGGHAIIVDSGVHGYDGDAFREYCRSTRAHSTVSIDRREQSEMWGTFRVAGRAAARAATIANGPGDFVFTGTCSPHHWRAATHQRVIRGSRGTWTITDRVTGAAGARLDSFLHLHPEAQIQGVGPGYRISRGDTRLRLETFGVDATRIVRASMQPVQGWHCARFGEARPSDTVEATILVNDGREFGFRILPDEA